MENKRPVLLTVLCVLGFIGLPLTVVISVLSLTSGKATIFGEPWVDWYAIANLFFAAVYLIALIMIWKMKKLGMIVYAVMVVIDYITMYAAGSFSITNAVISAIIIILFFTQFKKTA
ncbi:hypothetical protein ACFL6D_02730 [Spirochaetota bacterium]